MTQAEALLLQIQELDAHIERLIDKARKLQSKISKVPAASR